MKLIHFPKLISRCASYSRFLRMEKKIQPSSSQAEDTPSRPQKSFQCHQCETKCASSGALRKHKSRKHRKQINIPNEVDPDICYRCNIKFKKQENLVSHMTKFHRQIKVEDAVKAKEILDDTIDPSDKENQIDNWIKEVKIQVETEQKLLHYFESFLYLSKALHDNLDTFIAIFKRHS